MRENVGVHGVMISSGSRSRTSKPVGHSRSGDGLCFNGSWIDHRVVMPLVQRLRGGIVLFARRALTEIDPMSGHDGVRWLGSWRVVARATCSPRLSEQAMCLNWMVERC